MKDFLPFFAYIAAVAYLPLLFVTVKTVSLKKLGDLTFVRSLAKDYLRTVPIVALVALPVLAYPPLTRPSVTFCARNSRVSRALETKSE